jgi:phosphotransferase system  glucose/maltose/N-acetylglucosamine-specific IIC component
LKGLTLAVGKPVVKEEPPANTMNNLQTMLRSFTVKMNGQRQMIQNMRFQEAKRKNVFVLFVIFIFFFFFILFQFAFFMRQNNLVRPGQTASVSDETEGKKGVPSAVSQYVIFDFCYIR